MTTGWNDFVDEEEWPDDEAFPDGGASPDDGFSLRTAEWIVGQGEEGQRIDKFVADRLEGSASRT